MVDLAWQRPHHWGRCFLASYWWTLHARTLAQQRAKEWLDRTAAIHRPVPRPEVPPVPRVQRGDVVGELEIPRLQVSVMIFEGDDAAILKRGAGHIPGTALPAGSGNIGIAAHRDTYFRPLRGIRANDILTLKSQAGPSRYTVTDTEIV